VKGRTRWTGRAAALALVAALLMPGHALGLPADDVGKPAAPGPHPAAMVVDAVVMRPLGFCAAIVGAALFPFVALATLPEGMSGIEEAWELMVLVPGKNVFQRPLGDF
jgi:hypothetical protein